MTHISATPVTVSVGITGHRAHNAVFAANRDRIDAVLRDILSGIEKTIRTEASGPIAPTRMHSMLSDGTDQMAAEMALALGWTLVSPLPFGLALNTAINAHPLDVQDARALLEGRDAADPATQSRAQAIRAFAAKARLFELADNDTAIATLFLARHEAPGDFTKAQRFVAESSERAALASRIVIEQSDIVLAVWDGESTAHGGGTGHTVAAALDLGAPVIWIDANAPESWRILRATESLATLKSSSAPRGRQAEIDALIGDILRPTKATKRGHGKGDHAGVRELERERWHKRSSPIWHAYRRVETLFGADTFAQRLRNLRQTYEAPDAIATGSAAPMLACARALPGQDGAFVSKMESAVLQRFAWFDGVSSRLSDNYRGGMVVNFLLAPFAIIAGITYLPFASSHEKWLFALVEFMLLVNIIAITTLGRLRRWHGRWFQTRRVAEYLRHAPILLILGVARPSGSWPRGVDASWPERFARQALREVGLPHISVTPPYLRIALRELLDDHAVRQRDYHIGKAKRLAAAHRNLDRFSSLLFMLAVISVSSYLILKASGAFEIWPAEVSDRVTHLFTFLGVFFPTFGGAVAGIRYFGDFERFSAISEVTAEKLDAVHSRIRLLLSGPDDEIDYGRVSDLAQATDDIVVAEIENWQAVFGGKHITVPI